MTHKNNIQYEALNMEIHEELALQAIEQQKEEKPQMLPFTLDGFRAYSLGVIAHIDGKRFVGVNAVINEYKSHKVLEVGGLYIAPEKRGNGYTWPLKAELMKLIAKQYGGWKVMIFVNPSSEPINRKLGFTDATEIPEEAYIPCNDCPSKINGLPSGVKCCDTVVALQI